LKGRDMNGFKVSAIGFALACLALGAVAQGTTTTDPKKAPKAEETQDPKKAPPAAPKAGAEKTAAKKAETTKAPTTKESHKATARKADDRAQMTSQGGTVQKYQAGKAPDLKDSKGNTVQTSPDAYDISSATSPPPKKK
jgi:hypothetical protein